MTKTETVKAMISHIETHLYEKLDLHDIATALHYSKYYLHHCFREELGITVHGYVLRRRMSEAAKLLVFSEKSILEIAMYSGYETQQAFSSCFKSLYKKTPLHYRQSACYYPLQLPYSLHTMEALPKPQEAMISLATMEDIPAWMTFLDLVVDGFPFLDKSQYLEVLQQRIQDGCAWIMKDMQVVIGAMIFQHQHIEFLAVHPQYKSEQVPALFLKYIFKAIGRERISITTFREGDKADIGQRIALQELGFTEADLLIEFEYPTQRFLLDPQLVTEEETSDECTR